MAGTIIGTLRHDQPVDLRTVIGMLVIVGGIVLVQPGRGATAH